MSDPLAGHLKSEAVAVISQKRFTNPATSDVQYTDDERNFMLAMDAYKRANNRPYPTWKETLAVLVSLGWRRVAEPVEPPRFKGIKG